MGSSGAGSFSDYSGTNDQNGGATGGTSGDDQCSRAFSTHLEDISDYDLFKNSGTVPVLGATLTVALRGRLVALDAAGTEVGALPTKLNYLAGCLKDGFTYVGIVTSSGLTPMPRVVADFSVG